MSDELIKVWGGDTGYCLGENYGRGSLLPYYDSASTLTEATQGRPTPGHDTGSKGTQTRYGPETRRAIRAAYHTRTMAEIARDVRRGLEELAEAL